MSRNQLPKFKVKDISSARAFTDEKVIEKWRAKASTSAIKAMDPDTTITIYDIIGEDFWGEGVTAKRVSGALRTIGDKDITVAINSPGGDMFEGFTIFNLLRDHPGKVTVKIMGYAASAASIIAMAGDKIEMGASSFLMIHNAWVGAHGNRHDLAEVAEWLAPFDAAMAGIYEAVSGQKLKTITKMMDVETWIGAEEAISMGFADGLLPADQEDKKAAAKASTTAEGVRAIERALMDAGSTRTEARAHIKNLKGKQDATQNGKQDATALEGIHALIKAMKPNTA